MLYVVPTPVGNLDDITLRAVKVLSEVDLILAEDTRTSSILLKHLEISKPMISFHKFNEHQILSAITDRLLSGEQMALISDAGTPGISDPGFLLVRQCVEKEIEVTCLPGPTAFVPALVASGLPADRFSFEGFLPLKKGRHTRLTELSEEDRTIIFYESPHRLQSTLKEMTEYFGGERNAVVAREISKHFEEFKRDSLENLAAYYSENQIKGEIVVLIKGIGRKKKKNRNEEY